MSSSSGKSFTGMALVVLALFGIGGALVDKWRHANDDQKIVDPLTVEPAVDRGAQVVSTQKPGFIGANLANDGTGRLAGNALPGSKVALDLNSKTITTAQVSKSGEFSVELEQPLVAGKHVLQLKTVGSAKNAPVRSDQQIKLNVRKGKDIVVTFLEPGQPPQVLQGVEEKSAQIKLPQSPPPVVKKSTPPMVKEQPKLATSTPSTSESGPSESGPSKSDRPNILFKETIYIDEAGQAGQIKLSGTAQAGAKLHFTIDGIELGNTVADKTGAWSLQTKQQLSLGGHMLLAEQLNDKGVRIAHAQVPFDRAGTPETGAKESVWDKFTGIFKVEPDIKDQTPMVAPGTPKKAAPGEAAPMNSGSGKADQGKLADASKPKSKPIAALTKTSGTEKFAFESVSYEANAAGGLLELSGRGIAGSRVRLFEGIQEIGEVVANSKGIWTFSKPGKIKPGPHMFKAAHVLKSGRIASETRMQYDHVDVIGGVRNNKIAANKLAVDRSKEDKRASANAPEMATGQVAPIFGPAPNGAGADHSVPTGPSGLPVDGNPQSGPAAQALMPRSKMKKAGTRRVHRAQKPRRKMTRRSAKRRSVARYYLSRKNKARYMAKRKRYPKSRATPARVRVRNGTTLWGYSKHYYGRGRLYPHIRRANRRKIKNPNRIYIGQRIRVPRLHKKRRKKR